MKPTPLLLAALAILAGCGKPRTRPAPAPAPAQAALPAPRTDGRPSWVMLPQTCPGLTASTVAEVGSEGPNAAGDLMLQRKLALLHARYQVAARIDNAVQGFLKHAQLVDSGSSAGDGPAVSAQAVSTASQGLETELVSASLAGVTPREFWIEPGTGRLYVLVTLERDALAGSIQATLAGRGRDAATRIAESQQLLDAMLASRSAGAAQ